MMFLSAANEDVVPADIAVLGLCRWGESPGGTRLRVLDDVGAVGMGVTGAYCPPCLEYWTVSRTLKDYVKCKLLKNKE
jgi:hypothetical protein